MGYFFERGEVGGSTGKKQLLTMDRVVSSGQRACFDSGYGHYGPEEEEEEDADGHCEQEGPHCAHVLHSVLTAVDAHNAVLQQIKKQL